MAPGGTAVVRSGGDGVCFCSCVGDNGEVGEVKWVEAVFGKDEQDRVVDVTGGGNGLLGGMGAGLLISGGDAYEGGFRVSFPLLDLPRRVGKLMAFLLSSLYISLLFRYPLRLRRCFFRHRAIWTSQDADPRVRWTGSLVRRGGDGVGEVGEV